MRRRRFLKLGLAGVGVTALRPLPMFSLPSDASEYYVAYQPDLQCYPNYSFGIGDLDGDGRMELVSVDQTGNRLRAITLEGKEVFEKRLNNNAIWGTGNIAVTDLNGDGRAEVAAPASTDRIQLFNGKGQQMAEYVTGSSAKDHFGMGIPLMAPFRSSNKPGLIAAVAGGRIVALDGNLKELWRSDGFRHDFGHELFVADIGDGFDEVVAFSTVDNINKGLQDNHGDIVILGHDGRVILRERVDRYWPDAHFDTIAFADFRGIGKTEVMLEKGILINLHGDVVWDASKNFEHGQWIAHFPDPSGTGQRIVISELWGKGRKNVILSGKNGEVLATITNPARTELDQATFPHWQVRPTRCHVVRWTPDAAPEIFLGEQALPGGGPGPQSGVGASYDLKASFVDIDGRLLGVLPFRDRQVEGYFYNAEVHSFVADVDGDGRQEVVFPRQDGHVMVIKKREKGKK